MYTLLVVDDEYYLRLGFKTLLEWEKLNIEVVGEAADGEEGLKLALQYRPNLIVTDIRMPYMNGLELMEKLRENHLECEVIVLSGYGEFEYAQKAIDNGAFAYLLKPIDPERFQDTLRKALEHIKIEQSSRRYYEFLKSEISAIKENFLINLLKGNERYGAQTAEKLKILDIPLDSGDCMVVVIRMDCGDVPARQMDRQELDRKKQQVEGEIVQTLLLRSDFMGVLIHMEPYCWSVVVNLRHDREKGRTSLKAAAESFSKSCRGKFQCTFSIGISNICPNIGQIADAYRVADELSKTKLLPGITSIASADDGESFACRREIREVLRYIKLNYARNISVETASQHVYISPSYLMHLLHSELGKTFNECLMECRVEVAKNLLKIPGEKIYEVAQKVGYRDVKYFSRVFKKVTGLNPSEYIDMLGNNE